jgi:hypothetical protein
MSGRPIMLNGGPGSKCPYCRQPRRIQKEQFIDPYPLWDPQLAKLAGIAGIKLFGLVAIQLDKSEAGI